MAEGDRRNIRPRKLTANQILTELQRIDWNDSGDDEDIVDEIDEYGLL